MSFAVSASPFRSPYPAAEAAQRGLRPVDPVKEPKPVGRAVKTDHAKKAEDPAGYKKPEPTAHQRKAQIASKRMDAMLAAMRDLRSRSADFAESPALYAAGEGGKLTGWDAGGAQLQSMKIDYAAMSTGKGAGQALIAQAVYGTEDGGRIEASFATMEIEGYGEITFASVSFADSDVPGFDPHQTISLATNGEGENPGVAVKAEGAEVVSGKTGDGDDAINLQAQLVAQFEAGGGNDIMTVAAKVGINLFAGLGDDIMHVEGDYLRNISGDGGDDLMLVKGRDVSGVFGGAGNDSMHVLGESGQHVNGGSGDDIIALWSKSGSLDVTPGGGKDIVTLGEDGDYAVNISPELAQSAEDVKVEDLGGGALRLSFKDGSQTTLMGVDKAAGLKIGNESWSLDLKQPEAA